MKHFLLIAIIASFFSLSAFAEGEGQSDTDCPMMKESTSRANPKSNLDQSGNVIKSQSSSAVEG